VEFVLKSVLDLLFQIFRHVISMSDVPNPCHWNCTHELISKTWKLCFQKSDNVTIANTKSRRIILEFTIFLIGIIYHSQLIVTHFKHTICESSMVIWPVMPFIATFNMSCVDKIKEC
jgi:hydrogenase maturation factor HypE